MALLTSSNVRVSELIEQKGVAAGNITKEQLEQQFERACTAHCSSNCIGRLTNSNKHDRKLAKEKSGVWLASDTEDTKALIKGGKPASDTRRRAVTGGGLASTADRDADSVQRRNPRSRGIAGSAGGAARSAAS
ncbi:unnamed protein product [Phytophthora lilii]|uniref:Unnamed protein product n=1 Tax=Phytophthora lilii TaxID=2077276 RepID=A0A9W6WIR6_9STRA|nr:unnamed protein product [Phytophthora lilii]